MLQNHFTDQQSNHCSKTVPRKRLRAQGESDCTGSLTAQGVSLDSETGRLSLHRESLTAQGVPLHRGCPWTARLPLCRESLPLLCTGRPTRYITGRVCLYRDFTLLWQWQWHCHSVNGSGTATVVVPVSLC